MKRQISNKGMGGALIATAILASMGAAIARAHQVKPGIGALIAVLLFAIALFAPKPGTAKNCQTAGINVEMWENHIEENIYPGNEFLMAMTDLSEYVNVLTVHDPQAGAAPSVTKNRAKGGARVDPTLRTDTTNDWSIDEYTSAPVIITNAEEVQLSYDKMTSVLYNTEAELRRVIANNIIVNICPTGTATLPANKGGGTNANILRSTGITNNDTADVRTIVAYTPSATGNRLTFTLYDLRQAAKSLDKLDIPDEDRYMLMSADAKQQIINDLIVTKYRGDVTDVFDTASGQIKKLMGFTIFVRSSTCVYDNTVGTPVVKAYGAAGAATDNDTILFWQKNFVGKAIGDIHVYETLNSATDYGDIYSALIRMGANKRRTSEMGVGAIVQAASV